MPEIKAHVSPRLLAALDRAAADADQSRAATMREILTAGLAAWGYWPRENRDTGLSWPVESTIGTAVVTGHEPIDVLDADGRRLQSLRLPERTP